MNTHWLPVMSVVNLPNKNGGTGMTESRLGDVLRLHGAAA
jgi:hypothetical protein